MSEIKKPILVMQANPDKGSALTNEGVTHIKKYNPNAKIARFQEAGHVIHRSDEKKFLNILNDFLEKD